MKGMLLVLFPFVCNADTTFRRRWMKGSLQTRLINAQIWKCSAIMVTTVVLVLLSEFSALKIDTRLQLWQNKKPTEGNGKRTEISGFAEYLATLAPDPGLFFGFTWVQGNVSHVSTLFWLLLSTQWAVGLGHGTPVWVRFCFYPVLVVVGWGSQLHERGHTGLRPEGVKDDSTVNTL